MIKTVIFVALFFSEILIAQSKLGFQIARVKYLGGGDWYNDPSAEVNLLKFFEANTKIKTIPEYTFVDLESSDLFNFPMLFITGHGNIVFSEEHQKKIKDYLESGGFIYIDDDYGLDNALQREFKRIFPNNNFQEIPFDHQIYHSFYDFENGPPKTHEHDNKPPKGYGLFIGERMVIYYNVESNPSDGWADQKVHNDTPEKREAALKFGTNIIMFRLTQ